MTAAPIDRATADDVMSLATDVGSAPMQVGAVLLLDAGAASDVRSITAAIAERIATVPRLRQRLVDAPFGCGRPCWVDDAAFDIAEHLTFVECPAPSDEEAVLAVAAELVASRLPPDRPMWAMTWVTGLDSDRSAVVVVFHHVLADGIGGLAVLANLVDGAPITIDRDFPRSAPSTRALAIDAARARVATITRLGTSLRRLRDAVVQLRSTSGTKAARCSLNRPTGPRRRFAVVRADVDEVHRAAHEHGATINDVVLAAVASSLRTLLATRGEDVDRFVVSVPMSARAETTADHLGNEVGAVPVEVPAAGEAARRIAQIAERTRAAKRTSRAASSALLGPVFRLLARLGIFQWFIDRQRLVHTFTTNLRGPASELSLLGRPIRIIIPMAVVTGNVTISFAVLSYAGTLVVTVIADPDACPDLDVLRDALQRQLGLQALLELRDTTEARE